MPGRAIAILGVVVALGIVWVGAGQWSRLRAQLQANREQLAALTTQNRTLTEQLAAFEEERGGFEERLAEVRSQLARATTELERARQSLRELETREGQLRTERDQLKAQVGSLQVAREEVEAKANRLAEENAKLTHTLGRLRGRMALLEHDLQQLKVQLASIQTHHPISIGSGLLPELPGNPPATSPQAGAALPPSDPSPPEPPPEATVELPPIIVRKEQAAMPLPVQGRVVEVNTEHAFIIVDQGSRDGVQPGMRFDLVRAGKTIGQATVVRLRPHLAACDLSDIARGPIQAGDLAVQASEQVSD